MKPPMEFSTRIILLYWALDFSCTLNNEGPTTISTKQELDFSPFVFSTSVQNIIFFSERDFFCIEVTSRSRKKAHGIMSSLQ